MRSEQEIRNLMVSCFKMANASYEQGNLDKAYEFFRMSLERGLELCSQSEDLFDRAEYLPQIYERLCRVCDQLNCLEEAAAYCRKGLAQREAALRILRREDWIESTKRAIVRDCKYLASLYGRMEDEENVLWSCREGISFSAELYNAGRTEEDGRYFISFAARLGYNAYLTEELDQALRYFLDMMTVLDHLKNGADGSDKREEVATYCGVLGNIYYKKGDYQQAGQYYAKKLELHKKLFDESLSTEMFGLCAWDYYDLSLILDDADQRECLERAMDILNCIVGKHPELEEKYQELGIRCMIKLQRFRN